MATVKRIRFGRNISFSLNNKDVFVKPKVEFEIECSPDEEPSEAIASVAAEYERCLLTETLQSLGFAVDCIESGSVKRLAESIETRLDELDKEESKDG